LDLGKQVADVAFGGDVHIQHDHLVAVESQLILLHVDTLPELSYFLLDQVANLAENF